MAFSLLCLNLLCVFDLFFQNAGSQLCFSLLLWFLVAAAIVVAVAVFVFVVVAVVVVIVVVAVVVVEPVAENLR